MSNPLQALSLTTRALGYGGLIPFVVLAAAVVFNLDNFVPGAKSNAQGLLNYAAVIVSFLGAVHWGVALSDSESRQWHFLYGVFPALLAWALLFAPEKPALFGMALVVIFAFVVDYFILFKQISYQYAPMRLHLTIVVSLSLLVAALAL